MNRISDESRKPVARAARLSPAQPAEPARCSGGVTGRVPDAEQASRPFYGP